MRKLSLPGGAGRQAPHARAAAFSAAGAYRLPDAMASLWRRADAAAQQVDRQDSSSSSSSKMRSSDDAGNDDNQDQASSFGPDISTLSIGSGEGATSLRADRCVTQRAPRSGFFRACLRGGESSFRRRRGA